MIKPGETYRIKGESKYFARKYGTPNPQIVIEAPLDYHESYTPPSFLYLGRMLAEGLPPDGKTYYGHIEGDGRGELVHETELESEGE